mmetsp:Transcript_21810/g.53400  ORF Transcript_21810/g.53400 Transcript_21810/m.53400 type:complete len:230 (+) Transcript_21810:1548-2237(+)
MKKKSRSDQNVSKFLWQAIPEDMIQMFLEIGVSVLLHVTQSFPDMLNEFVGTRSSTDDMSSLPNHLVCYLCGRKYGTTSLEIHLPQCERLWVKRESTRPAKERKRLPSPPEGWQIWREGMSVADRQRLNMLALRLYRNRVLCRCKNCGRTFFEAAYKRHVRGCQAGHVYRPVNLPREARQLLQHLNVAKMEIEAILSKVSGSPLGELNTKSEKLIHVIEDLESEYLLNC